MMATTWLWPFNVISAQLAAMDAKLNQIIQTETKQMAELDDLTAAVAAIGTAVTNASAEMKAEADKIVALLAAPGGVDPAAVEAAAQNISNMAAALQSNVDAAKTAAGV